MNDTDWYYCLTHHAVEPLDGCKAEERLGPYPNYADAAAALDQVNKRNEAWDNDPRFNDDAEKPADLRDDDHWNPFGA